jgi:hypothetical protein
MMFSKSQDSLHPAVSLATQETADWEPHRVLVAQRTLEVARREGKPPLPLAVNALIVVPCHPAASVRRDNV